MSTKLAKWIFYGGTLSSALLFLILTWDTHRQIDTLTHADKLSRQRGGRQKSVSEIQLQRLPHHFRIRRVLRPRPHQGISTPG